MTKFLAAAFLAATLATPAAASDDGSVDVHENCATIGKLATSVMRGRQNGFPLSEAMSFIRERETEHNPVAPMMRDMILDAYERPQFSDASFQQRSIADFSEEYMLACYASHD